MCVFNVCASAYDNDCNNVCDRAYSNASITEYGNGYTNMCVLLCDSAIIESKFIKL